MKVQGQVTFRPRSVASSSRFHQVPHRGFFMHRRNFVLVLLLVLLFTNLALASAQAAEKRIALVVGNANYSSGALPTPANDAGLIAQTLQAAGFDVVGVRDLDQDSLRRTFRDFIAKVSAAGPDTVSFIYLSGYGLQLEGENYFVPTDANIARDVNVSSEALRLSDYTKPLAALGIKVSIVVLDGARASPFAKSGPPACGWPGPCRARPWNSDRLQCCAGNGGAERGW